jgi:serine/threonine protein kinase
VSEQPPGEPGPGHPGGDGEPGGFTPGSAAEFGPGARIAGYRLEERIGRGGMAVVYRAYDSRLDRQVALKILAPGLAADDAFRRRFIRESRAAAAVDDPHIIPVFEAGDSRGVLFIAMRYVRGGDVRSLLDRIGPLPAAQAAEIIFQAASALDAAHARGLVHRDVKPANMLLEASGAVDQPGHVYLSDFGLSKTSLAASGLTSTGQFLGTLDYVAPEQIEGLVLDGRSDLYSLACSAFEMLCGEPPFRREQGVSVMYAHLSEVPPPLTLRRPELPAVVDAVLARALAKVPAERYASCREFAAALRSALSPATAKIEPGRPSAHPVTEVAMPPARERGPAPGSVGRELAAAAGTHDAGDTPPPARVPGPSESPGAARGPDVAGAARPAGPGLPPAAPPLTQPVGIVRLTRPGLTDPSAGNGGWGGSTRRPWWRSPAPVAGVCAVVLVAAAGAYLAARGGSGNGHRPAGSTGLTIPGCTTATAKAPTLTGVTSATTAIPGSPFGVAVAPNGLYSFVSGGNSVAVLSNGTALAPKLVATYKVLGADRGDAVTKDGNYLLAAAGSGAAVINVAQAVQGAANPVAGMLTSPHGSGAVEVLITANDKYAFVTLQNSAELAVFNLHLGLTQGFSQAFIGDVPLPKQPVGMATDGTWLYVASIQGNVSVLNMAKAETPHAKGVVVATAPAGCGATRAVLSRDHKVLWVTDRQGNAVVALSVARLRSDPQHALLAKVMIGQTPVGEALCRGGSRLVVADANLNNATGDSSSLAVIDTAKALSGQPALLGYVRTGLVPRQFAEPGGKTLLVTLQNSRQLQAIKIAKLP